MSGPQNEINFGSSEAASLGGKARAERLSPERRREIARAAVGARWAKEGKVTRPIPTATHEGTLRLGSVEIPCYVLENQERVVSTRGVMRALGRVWRGRKYAGTQLPVFAEAKNLKEFIDSELEAVLSPFEMLTPRGLRAEAIRAVAIPAVCEVYLRGREKKVLTGQQLRIAQQCEVLLRGLANVAIIALVDEATGYQDDRDRRALAKILEAFVAKELRRWIQTFPADYYREMYRLRGLTYPPAGNRMPQYFGKLTNDVVYARLAPGVLEELRRTIPRDDKGRLKAHLHRKLTEDVGHPKLLQHLGAVVAVMKMTDDRDWSSFMRQLDKHYPRQTPMPLFDGKAVPPATDDLSGGHA